MSSKFWIVIGERRGAAPFPYRHTTEQSAFDESARLARMHGGKFFVLECIGAASKQDITMQRFTNHGDEEIPF